jgi:signal transduction histidine kinase
VVQPIEDIVALADASKTTQILINLLTNGVKYTPAGGVVWLVSRQDDRAVYFDVTDTGPGIAPEHLSVIFDPYVQLERRVPQELDGCGLGLAIGREFAAAMRGELTVKSEVGRGSTFTLRLPRFRPGVAVHSRNAERRTRVV